jgi:pSer/pThr/pTyr-binding forkhead associated (FHA) protein
MVKVHGDEAHVFDLGSVGGTKVNGKEIGGGALGLNSVIKIGETELTLLQVDNPRQFAQGKSGSDTLIDNRGEKAPALLVTSGIDSGKSYILREGDNAIGRADESHIALSDDSVSRRHAVVRCQNGKMTLLDVGSRSGTELNGRKLSGHSLSHGDVISIGRSEFTMMAPKSQPVAA